ncbi:flagellar filament capping protein FliD [Lysobacter yangpyeongensis]|uniref:Flagellar hook-associated protein 2 n=1 Tax=Lysobacter yangpyeongensis TaxID=346182 RepID=A0ABW0SIX4_9GAMM
MSITSTGIGSGLDVASLVQQLVAADRAPTANRIDALESKTKAQISAFGALRSAFDSLRTAIGKLRSGDTVDARKATVQSDAGFTASATAKAAVGTYSVEVLARASAHKLASQAYAAADTSVGNGHLTITSGETTLEVDIDAEHATLQGVRDAINKAAQGKGVTATIVTADDGARLVLSATATGADNALAIAASGGDGGLSALAYAPPAATTMTQLQAATDAKVKVDGFVRSSASDTIGDMIEGVTLTLTEAEPGTVKQLTVATDPSVLRSAAKSFVSSWNSAINAMASTTKYDPATKVAAALNGDALVRGVARDLRGQLGDSVADLKALGITIDTNGTLKLDEAAFDAGMAKDPAAAARLFTADDGLAAGLDASLDHLLDSDGLLKSRDDDLASRTRSIADQRAALDTRMSALEARYRAQFVALDELMTRMQSTSSYLAQQLDKL